MSKVVGIDYDSYKATLVALPLDGSIGRVTKTQVRFRKDSQSGDDAAIAALGVVRDAVIGGLTALASDLSSTVVWIERGYGQSRRSDWSLGAFFGAIYSTCASLPLHGLNEMNLQEWKRIVTGTSGIGLVKDGTRGNGQAKKAVANEACRALLALGEIDASGWTPDELDAFGVAFAARDLNREALAQQLVEEPIPVQTTIHDFV